MSPQARILHRVANPISVQEFRDVVLAICRPRFPNVHYARPQRIALAISGGVDSMALAYLFASLLRTYKGIKIADNPAERVSGIVVDHGLREGSDREASRVSGELKRLGLRALVKTLNWRELRDLGVEPATLPNVESLARTMRYQAIGIACRTMHSNSLFFAHHRDDQYETVLMRLLAGHGYRGLQGIREANAIPECYELHGVYKSGLLDDQIQAKPFLSFKPANKEMRRLRHTLKDDREGEPWHQIKSYLSLDDMSSRFPGQLFREVYPRAPYLTPLHSEEGGVTIYRPLLEFDKDRLIATCEANSVTWFEDHTNKDPTLTARNAIRHLAATHTLPKALQKPAILALSERSKQRNRMQEAAAHRLLVRQAAIKDFDPNAGTLLIDLPKIQASSFHLQRGFSQRREEARRPLRRRTAAMAIRKLVEFVTPERHLPPLTSLENVVDRLYPDLSLNPGAKGERSEPKAFCIAGVLFSPVSGANSTKWFLSRAPYLSNQSLPERKLPGYLNYYKSDAGQSEADDQTNRSGHWRSWKTPQIWDGRFWIRVSACVAARFHVLPFQPAHAKPFRMALPAKERARFEKILKHYAPGKVRYTLPALYSVESSSEADAESDITLLALPSLGIHVPGLERWVRYEVRYKNIDTTLLGRKKNQSRASFPYRPHSGGKVRKQLRNGKAVRHPYMSKKLKAYLSR